MHAIIGMNEATGYKSKQLSDSDHAVHSRRGALCRFASLHTNTDAQHGMCAVRIVRSRRHTATYRKHHQPQVEAVQSGERCLERPFHPGQLGCPRRSTHKKYQTNRVGESPEQVAIVCYLL